MFNRLYRSFSPAAWPLMTRPSYRCELAASTTMPVAIGLLEGGVVGVLAKSVFGVGDFGFSTILAAPMFANLVSGLWARVARGRAKVPMICWLMSGVLAVNAAVALLPVGPAWSGAVLVGLVVVSRCLLAGVINLRSTVWRLNYPVSVRGRLTSKFILLATIGSSLGPLIGYAAADWGAGMFRVVYGVSAALGMVGVMAFGRIRLRHERVQLRYERAARGGPGALDVGVLQAPVEAQADATSVDAEAMTRRAGATSGGGGEGGGGFVAVLRHDHAFRAYMTWQFVGGMANLIGEAAIIRYIVGAVNGMRYDKALAVGLNVSLVTLMVALSLPLWARYFDRVHITTFRSRQGFLWVVVQPLNLLVTLSGLWWLLPGPRMLQGVAFGGGRLAWTLGHNAFGDRRLSAVYMGIHQTLTGVRGVIASYLGVYLLVGWEGRRLGPVIVPGSEGLGAWVFALTTGLALVSWGGFMSMHLKHRGVVGA